MYRFVKLFFLASLIGNLEDTLYQDEYINDFSSIASSMPILFAVMNWDLFPESMIPAI